MPTIFDNIDKSLLPTLKEVLEVSNSADFCVGYFNLRGWKEIDEYIEKWSGIGGNACRLLVGMQQPPEKNIRKKFASTYKDKPTDHKGVIKLKETLAEEFKEQLLLGVPKNSDEQGLRRLVKQLRAKKVIVKLFLRHNLHAKLYLLHRLDNINPKVAFVGSSNLTLAGLSSQGELNVDVMDGDACNKLADWFEERWHDDFCLEITDELADIIEDSWVSEKVRHPYHVYLKIAYHLSREAREGQSDFRIPKIFGDDLFPFQENAVKIAAHHLNKRRGVMIGDVVGLGKTIVGSALLKIREDTGGRGLIICPKNLVRMWEDYMEKYELHAKVVPLSIVEKELPKLMRYQTILIDESHNLRNREGMRYKVIENYIRDNDSRCILLSATPYNKELKDLSSQLRLFLGDDQDIGVRPDVYIREVGEAEFMSQHSGNPKSILAFEKSKKIDDWRELMRRFMVRRTRGFIVRNYAKSDNGNKYITASDGTTRFYFPVRQPKTIKFDVQDKENDLYAKTYSDEVLEAIGSLKLPRYGLKEYVHIKDSREFRPTPQEQKILESLSKAGVNLMGFCRTGLFKRLESGGPAFILSIKRHIMRNLVVLHAIENGHPIPIGSQDPSFLDISDDEDMDMEYTESLLEEEDAQIQERDLLRKRSANIYDEYDKSARHRFKWIKSGFFSSNLARDLNNDVDILMKVLSICGVWDDDKDNKLTELKKLLNEKKNEKVLIFTQFADTARHLETALKDAGVDKIAAATGSSDNLTELAWRFSPVSNNKGDLAKQKGEINIMIATDVLSEGQNLQDCSIIVNFDLPWAIIRLIQRAGRVDRIGQRADTVYCYSFLPAEGIDKIIQLRDRVSKRLKENQEVVGSDEVFFEGDDYKNSLEDLYSEKSGILDEKDDEDVDIVSYAYQIWENATKDNQELRKTIEKLPDVVYATKKIDKKEEYPQGALVYIRTPDDVDALAYVSHDGQIFTQSPKRILDAAECGPEEVALEKMDEHHDIVAKGVTHIMQEEERNTHGSLGRPNGAQYKAYDRLKKILIDLGDKRDIFFTDERVREIDRTIEDIYKYPLRQTAKNVINSHLKTGVRDDDFVQIIKKLRDEKRLSVIQDKDDEDSDMRIICSMGLKFLA